MSDRRQGDDHSDDNNDPEENDNEQQLQEVLMTLRGQPQPQPPQVQQLPPAQQLPQVQQLPPVPQLSLVQQPPTIPQPPLVQPPPLVSHPPPVSQLLVGQGEPSQSQDLDMTQSLSDQQPGPSGLGQLPLMSPPVPSLGRGGGSSSSGSGSSSSLSNATVPHPHSIMPASPLHTQVPPPTSTSHPFHISPSQDVFSSEGGGGLIHVTFDTPEAALFSQSSPSLSSIPGPSGIGLPAEYQQLVAEREQREAEERDQQAQRLQELLQRSPQLREEPDSSQSDTEAGEGVQDPRVRALNQRVEAEVKRLHAKNVRVPGSTESSQSSDESPSRARTRPGGVPNLPPSSLTQVSARFEDQEVARTASSDSSSSSEVPFVPGLLGEQPKKKPKAKSPAVSVLGLLGEQPKKKPKTKTQAVPKLRTAKLQAIRERERAAELRASQQSVEGRLPSIPEQRDSEIEEETSVGVSGSQQSGAAASDQSTLGTQEQQGNSSVSQSSMEGSFQPAATSTPEEEMETSAQDTAGSQGSVQPVDDGHQREAVDEGGSSSPRARMDRANASQSQSCPLSGVESQSEIEEYVPDLSRQLRRTRLILRTNTLSQGYSSSEEPHALALLRNRDMPHSAGRQDWGASTDASTEYPSTITTSSGSTSSGSDSASITFTSSGSGRQSGRQSASTDSDSQPTSLSQPSQTVPLSSTPQDETTMPPPHTFGTPSLPTRKRTSNETTTSTSTTSSSSGHLEKTIGKRAPQTSLLTRKSSSSTSAESVRAQQEPPREPQTPDSQSLEPLEQSPFVLESQTSPEPRPPRGPVDPSEVIPATPPGEEQTEASSSHPQDRPMSQELFHESVNTDSQDIENQEPSWYVQFTTDTHAEEETGGSQPVKRALPHESSSSSGSERSSASPAPPPVKRRRTIGSASSSLDLPRWQVSSSNGSKLGPSMQAQPTSIPSLPKKSSSSRSRSKTGSGSGGGGSGSRSSSCSSSYSTTQSSSGTHTSSSDISSSSAPSVGSVERSISSDTLSAASGSSGSRSSGSNKSKGSSGDVSSSAASVGGGGSVERSISSEVLSGMSGSSVDRSSGIDRSNGCSGDISSSAASVGSGGRVERSISGEVLSGMSGRISGSNRPEGSGGSFKSDSQEGRRHASKDESSQQSASVGDYSEQRMTVETSLLETSTLSEAEKPDKPPTSFGVSIQPLDVSRSDSLVRLENPSPRNKCSADASFGKSESSQPTQQASVEVVEESVIFQESESIEVQPMDVAESEKQHSSSWHLQLSSTSTGSRPTDSLTGTSTTQTQHRAQKDPSARIEVEQREVSEQLHPPGSPEILEESAMTREEEEKMHTSPEIALQGTVNISMAQPPQQHGSTLEGPAPVVQIQQAIPSTSKDLEPMDVDYSREISTQSSFALHLSQSQTTPGSVTAPLEQQPSSSQLVAEEAVLCRTFGTSYGSLEELEEHERECPSLTEVDASVDSEVKPNDESISESQKQKSSSSESDTSLSGSSQSETKGSSSDSTPPDGGGGEGAGSSGIRGREKEDDTHTRDKEGDSSHDRKSGDYQDQAQPDDSSQQKQASGYGNKVLDGRAISLVEAGKPAAPERVGLRTGNSSQERPPPVFGTVQRPMPVYESIRCDSPSQDSVRSQHEPLSHPPVPGSQSVVFQVQVGPVSQSRSVESQHSLDVSQLTPSGTPFHLQLPQGGLLRPQLCITPPSQRGTRGGSVESSFSSPPFRCPYPGNNMSNGSISMLSPSELHYSLFRPVSPSQQSQSQSHSQNPRQRDPLPQGTSLFHVVEKSQPLSGNLKPGEVDSQTTSEGSKASCLDGGSSEGGHDSVDLIALTSSQTAATHTRERNILADETGSNSRSCSSQPKSQNTAVANTPHEQDSQQKKHESPEVASRSSQPKSPSSPRKCLSLKKVRSSPASKGAAENVTVGPAKNATNGRRLSELGCSGRDVKTAPGSRSRVESSGSDKSPGFVLGVSSQDSATHSEDGSQFLLPTVQVPTDSQFDSSGQSQFSLTTFKIDRPCGEPTSIPPPSVLRKPAPPPAESIFSNIGASRRTIRMTQTTSANQTRQSNPLLQSDPYEFHSQSQNTNVEFISKKSSNRKPIPSEEPTLSNGVVHVNGEDEAHAGGEDTNMDEGPVSSNGGGEDQGQPPLNLQVSTSPAEVQETDNQSQEAGAYETSTQDSETLSDISSSYGELSRYASSSVHPTSNPKTETRVPTQTQQSGSQTETDGRHSTSFQENEFKQPSHPQHINPGILFMSPLPSTPASLSSCQFTSPSSLVSPSGLQHFSQQSQGGRFELRCIKTYRTVIECRVVSAEVVEGNRVVDGHSRVWQESSSPHCSEHVEIKMVPILSTSESPSITLNYLPSQPPSSGTNIVNTTTSTAACSSFQSQITHSAFISPNLTSVTPSHSLISPAITTPQTRPQNTLPPVRLVQTASQTSLTSPLSPAQLPSPNQPLQDTSGNSNTTSAQLLLSVTQEQGNPSSSSNVSSTAITSIEESPIPPPSRQLNVSLLAEQQEQVASTSGEAESDLRRTAQRKVPSNSTGVHTRSRGIAHKSTPGSAKTTPIHSPSTPVRASPATRARKRLTHSPRQSKRAASSPQKSTSTPAKKRRTQTTAGRGGEREPSTGVRDRSQKTQDTASAGRGGEREFSTGVRDRSQKTQDTASASSGETGGRGRTQATASRGGTEASTAGRGRGQKRDRGSSGPSTAMREDNQPGPSGVVPPVTVGSRVLARWRDHHWYPGKIVAETKNGRMTVLYADNDKYTVSPSNMFPLHCVAESVGVVALKDDEEGKPELTGQFGGFIGPSLETFYLEVGGGEHRVRCETYRLMLPPHSAKTCMELVTSTATSGRKRQLSQEAGSSQEPPSKRKKTTPSPKGASIAEEEVPPAQQRMFDGYTFLLTQRTKEDRHSVTPPPGSVDRDLISSQIRARQGRVLDNHDKERVIEGQFFVVSDAFCRTRKYLTGLALGVPLVSYDWIKACISQGVVVDYKQHLLPAGVNNITKDIIKEQPRVRSILRNTRVYVTGSDGFKEFWTFVLVKAGAKVLAKLPCSHREEASTVDMVICESAESLPNSIRHRADTTGLRLLGTEWVAQSLICGKKLHNFRDYWYTQRF